MNQTTEKCLIISGDSRSLGEIVDTINDMQNDDHFSDGSFEVHKVNTGFSTLLAASDLLDAAIEMRKIGPKSTRADVDRACDTLDAAITRATARH